LGRECVLIRPDGNFVPISLTLLEMSVKGLEYYVYVCFDISERKDLERRLAISQRLESVGQLAAGIAHEINTPVQFISNNMGFLKEANDYFNGYIKACEAMFMDIQQDEDLPDAVKKAMSRREEEELAFYLDQSNLAIDESWDGVQRITSIVDSMRYFSHPGDENKASVDLNAAVENTVTVTKNEWKYASEMVLDLDPDLPKIKGLPADISQAVLNLVVNAAHAVSERFAGTEDKGVIMLKTYAEDGNAVIEITDNGGGIPKNIQSRVFDPFYTTKAVGKGTGQGLAIVHSVVVEKHGGVVDLQSEPGQGATFTIRLPIID
jgi:signal transduction histidine kinase